MELDSMKSHAGLAVARISRRETGATGDEVAEVQRLRFQREMALNPFMRGYWKTLKISEGMDDIRKQPPMFWLLNVNFFSVFNPPYTSERSNRPARKSYITHRRPSGALGCHPGEHGRVP